MVATPNLFLKTRFLFGSSSRRDPCCDNIQHTLQQNVYFIELLFNV